MPRTTPSQRVLVATDLSDHAAAALRQADAHAPAIDGVLGIVHVLPSPRVHMLFPERYSREAAEEASLGQRARELVARTASEILGRPRSARSTPCSQSSTLMQT